MRRLAPLALAAFSLSIFAACPPSGDGSDPDWLKPPISYKPKEADLTFNEMRLSEFNMMNDEERAAHVETLKAAKGQYKGQALSKTGAGLGPNMPDSKYGEYELNAVTDAILFEISLDYKLYTSTEIGDKIAPNRAVEFTGTLVELEFQEESKPRKLVLKVVTDTLAPMTD